MKLIFLLGGVIDIVIFCYTVYFLKKVRFYKCINEKMGSKILLWSRLIVLGGMSSMYISYYSFRAVLRGFDDTTQTFTIFQVLVWLYAFILYKFHIKTTKNEKLV